MTQKIKTICLRFRVSPEDFKLSKNKTIKVFKNSDSPARTVRSKIIITEEFYREFSPKEQKAVIWHELFHLRRFKILHLMLNILILGSEKKAHWKEEYDADNYAATNSSPAAVLSYLKKVEHFYNSGKAIYDEKSHPTVKDRIENIKKQNTVYKNHIYADNEDRKDVKRVAN